VDETEIAIIGAGPHGLAAAAHLRRAGRECRVFGDPMSFWREMPAGMVLRSNWTATSIAAPDGPLSLDRYCAATGAEFTTPVPLEEFIGYGTWVQRQVAPDVDRRRVSQVERDAGGFLLSMEDGDRVRARRTVVAAGIAPFVNRPSLPREIPGSFSSHTSEHRDLSRFSGQDVLVVGGGQSALESAALMHESGARVQVVTRSDHINWLHGGKYHRKLGRLAPLLYAPTDVGPMGLSKVVAKPNLFRRLPRSVQDPLAYRAIRPAGAAWLKPRLEEVPLHLHRRVSTARLSGTRLVVELDDTTSHVVDHVMFGTGYRVDISRYDFLSPQLLAQVGRAHGYPLLGPGMESTVPGLHFLGAPGAYSKGPIMRFVSGSWFGAESLTTFLSSRRTAAPLPTAAVATGSIPA
jgi:FAD-dependent urate hydroxylase